MTTNNEATFMLCDRFCQGFPFFFLAVSPFTKKLPCQKPTKSQNSAESLLVQRLTVAPSLGLQQALKSRVFNKSTTQARSFYFHRQPIGNIMVSTMFKN